MNKRLLLAIIAALAIGTGQTQVITSPDRVDELDDRAYATSSLTLSTDIDDRYIGGHIDINLYT